MKPRYPVWQAFLALLAGTFAAALAMAQEDNGFLLQGLNPQVNAADDPVTFTAGFLLDDNNRTGTLRVSAQVAEGWHIFSVTQPRGGPIRTEINVDETPGVQVSGEFQPDSDPHEVKYQYFDVPAEEHHGTVVWSVPLTFDDGLDFSSFEIPLRVSAQVCEDGEGGTCLQFNPKLVARLTTGDDLFTGEIRPDGAHATISGWADKTHAQAAGQLLLTVRLQPDDGWLLPDYAAVATPQLAPTLVVFAKRNDAEIDTAKRSAEPLTISRGEANWLVYDRAVELEFPINLPADIEPDRYAFTGWIGSQPLSQEAAISDGQPFAVQFAFDLVVGSTTVTAENPLVFSVPDNADYGEVATLAQKEFERTQKNAGAFADYPIAAILGFAFLAGLILNIMPCVLPVIGIKILSLVQQAGENPRRVLMLNLVFAAGIVSIFLLLALLAIFPLFLGKTIGWGGLFESQAFVITMVAVVFAFALSFLGVWEIPIPGFVATAGSGKAAQREGFTGAFLKGVLTTLLATPCSGPLLIPAVTWATAQPPALTLVVFLSLGLGMAFPFIVIGFQPKLVAWLPKPGEWMETFKQLMGFVLIGAAVFFFNPVIERYQLPVLTFLVFVGMACWMAGRISFVDAAAVRMRKWASSVALILAGAFVAFYLMIPQHELDWQDFSRKLVDDKVSQGHVVFIDFTADW